MPGRRGCVEYWYTILKIPLMKTLHLISFLIVAEIIQHMRINKQMTAKFSQTVANKRAGKSPQKYVKSLFEKKNCVSVRSHPLECRTPSYTI